MITVHLTDPKDAEHASASLAPLPMAGLVIAVWNLLDQACDLVQPELISIDNSQAIDLQFISQPSSKAAITRWVLRFGGVLTSDTRHTARGRQTRVCARFDYYGVHVKAYAYIPA